MSKKDEGDVGYGKPIVLSDGQFAGWTTFSNGADPFETLVGPFCFKIDDGHVICAFQPMSHHLNGGGAVHGGALLAFSDFALFAIAGDALSGAKGVTLTCNTEFLSPGGLDGWIEAEGEVLRAGRTMIFVRGLITQKKRSLLAFSGTIKIVA